MQFLESSVPAENNYYGLLLKKEFNLIRNSQDWKQWGQIYA
jgi:hypothetical protein